MIEITARLVRGAIYFSGELLECWITLRNVAPVDSPVPADPKTPVKTKDPKLLQAQESSGPAAIAFVSGQIHCQCSTEDSKVFIPSKPLSLDRSEFAGKRISTGVAELNSFCSVSTIPKLLVGNVNLEPGEELNVLYSELIPKANSPSFRGLLVRYAWKLAFGCQVLGRDTTVIHIPLFVMIVKDFDVLPAVDADTIPNNDLNDGVEHTPGEARFPNGDHSKYNGEHSRLSQSVSVESVMELLDGLTSRRTLRMYNIESAHGKVGKLSLSKTRFRLGEDISGRFDFRDRHVTCVQYLVSLIGEEHITEENKKSKNMPHSESTVCKMHDFCLCVEQSSFVLPVPLHITPSFRSDLERPPLVAAHFSAFMSIMFVGVKANHLLVPVELKWKLRIEFALSAEVLQLDVPSVGHDQQSVLWRPPLRVPVETLLWDIPVGIYPTDPMQVHSVHLKDSLGADIKVKI